VVWRIGSGDKKLGLSFLRRGVENWRKRHRSRASFWLHMIGIPGCFIVGPLLLIFAQWWLGVGMFVGGYALQLIGHLVEGNRSGEEILIRKLIDR